MGLFGFGSKKIEGIDTPHTAIMVAGHMILYALPYPKTGAPRAEQERFQRASSYSKILIGELASRGAYVLDDDADCYRDAQGRNVPESAVAASVSAAMRVLRDHGGSPAEPMDVKALAKSIAAVVNDEDNHRKATLACALAVARVTRPNSPAQEERLSALCRALRVEESDRDWVERELEKHWDEIDEIVSTRLRDGD